MWRSIHQAALKPKVSNKSTVLQKRSSSTSSSGVGGGKVVLGVIAVGTSAAAGAIVYGKYDPKFKNLLEKNIPYINAVYKLFPDEDHTEKPSLSPKISLEDKQKDVISTGLLRKKLEREKESAQAIKDNLPKIRDSTSIAKSDFKIINKSEIESDEEKLKKLENQESQHALNSRLITEGIKKVEKSCDEAKTAFDAANHAIKSHTKFLYEALDLPEGKDGDMLWKEVDKASFARNNALKTAEDKVAETKDLVEKLKLSLRKVLQEDANHPILKKGEDSIFKVLQELNNAQTEISSVEKEAKTAEEYQDLVKASKEQFRKELKIVLPNYIHDGKEKSMTDSDLNLLIAHAHRRIEQLQKKLAKQQVTEKVHIEEAIRKQKVIDDKLLDSKVETELEKQNVDLESAVSKRVAYLKENFEIELRQQLRRQAAAHSDHIQEVIKIQEKELDRKFSLELEEKLLHQKGVFISEVSGNMARLKGISAYLKAKSDFDKASKKAQALWLACQSMGSKISSDSTGHPCPLGKDIAAVKIAADEDNQFVASILAGIPPEAANRGVYTNEILKQRFQEIKEVCQKVAMIDENNDSLYRYTLSYLQSFLIIKTEYVPKAELEGKIAVDPSEWDTFDILSRVSYCMKINDLDQALRYANQLKGEPRVVAKDWMKEMRLLLETQLAVKALLAHAAAVGVQAYH